ncbi:hypothetical protein [Kribbella sp. NPDC004536]|uniref:hypothetical protein n=1 Tax=Kribbella sp. NPDC004536 TaxID=3364106 RepID=UPI003682344D
MRTEQDLQEAFEQLASTAPHPAGIRARIEDPPRPHRRTAVLVGTALVTATAAVAAVVVPRLLAPDTPAAGPASSWSRWLDLNLPRSVETVGERFTANRQDYELIDAARTTAPTYCQLQLHRNGDFDPSTIPAGSPTVDLGGRRARVVTSTPSKPFLPAPRTYFFSLVARVDKVVVWEPSAGIWALLTCESTNPRGTTPPVADPPIQADLSLATSLGRSIAQPAGVLRSPVKLGDGFTPRQVSYQPARSGVALSGDFTVLMSDGNPATGYRPHPTAVVSGNPWDPEAGDDLSIRYDTSPLWNQATKLRNGKDDAVIHGMKAYLVNQTLTYSKLDPTKATPSGPLNTLRLEKDGVALVITSFSAHPTLESLRRIAENVQLTASPKDPTRWFDAATAL